MVVNKGLGKQKNQTNKHGVVRTEEGIPWFLLQKKGRQVKRVE